MEKFTIKNVTLLQMLDAMEHLSDDAVFRWYQDSAINQEGAPGALDTLRITIGQVRKEMGWTRK